MNIFPQRFNPELAEGSYVAFSKQNMHIYQCFNELIDNSTTCGAKNIELVICQRDHFKHKVYVIDDGDGMSPETLKKCLNLGFSFQKGKGMSEHGAGLKNSLSTLVIPPKSDGGNCMVKIYSKEKRGNGEIFCLTADLKKTSDFEIDRVNSFPDFSTEVTQQLDPSTVIEFEIYRGGFDRIRRSLPATSKWKPDQKVSAYIGTLLEDFGVSYREALKSDENDRSFIQIRIWHSRVRYDVTPIPIPYMPGSEDEQIIGVESGGKIYNVKLRRGKLNPIKGYEKYYRASSDKCGIDVIKGKRTLQTGVLEELWPKIKVRHHDFNYFCGELILPEDFPLMSVINKTAPNYDCEAWQDLKRTMKSYPPDREKCKKQKLIYKKDEEEIKNELEKVLRNSNPDDQIIREFNVFPTGEKIDIYRKGKDCLYAYEIKIEQASTSDVYQLVKYWDGLVERGESPSRAFLIGKSSVKGLQKVIDNKNSHKDGNGNNYKLEFKDLSDFNLKIS